MLFMDRNDGPSQELNCQLDLSRFFPPSSIIDDYDTLIRHLDHDPEPTTVVVLMPQDGLRWPAQITIQMLASICERADGVVLMLTEIDIMIDHLDDLTRWPRLRIMAPAQHNFDAHHRPMMLWQHWIQDLRLSWQAANIRSYLDQVRDIQSRDYVFDVLLGGERPYRSLLYDLIESDADLDRRVIMTYYGRPGRRPKFMPEPGMQNILWPDPMHTGFKVPWGSVEMRAACVPPLSIYQQTWFTVLAETSAHGFLNFYTEKVAKPLLAGRLFLALGGQHYLRGLRDCGFETFGDVVDESYDLEADDTARVTMVFREMQRLSRCDPRQLWQKVRPILQHNQHLAWHGDFIAQAIRPVLQQTTPLV